MCLWRRSRWRLIFAASPFRELAALADLQDLVRDALARRFTVERELGRGGMGSVFLARDRKHNRSVAIKVLQPDIADAIGSDRFLREIEIAARLSHPHILPVFDSGRAAGLPYYVMPFVEGGTLRDRLRREGRLSVAETLAIASDLASALAFAHREGVVHRDVKPENILFSGELALLADFGVAKARDAALSTRRAPAVTPPALTDTGLSLGTPAYMSPEQCLALFDVDGRSDLYSLGCVIHEMLTGEAPFSAPTAAAILARRFSEEPPSVRVVRDDVPAEVEAAIRRALSRERAERFASVDEFAAALGGTAESNGEPTPVSAVSGRPRIGGRSLLIWC